MAKANDAPRIVLLHSNDLHSRLEQTIPMTAYIEETRRMLGSSHVLVLDVGDHMDRMRMETEGSDGLVNIDLMNAAGYDVVTLGNNEGLTFTPQQLDKAFGELATFQTVCANLSLARDGKRPPWLLPYTIIEKAGVSFGIIGVTAAYADFYILLDWEASDPLAAVAEQTASIRSQVDVVVILSHLGLQLDRHIAETVPGIDLILGGHTHHLLKEPEVIGQTYICASGKFGDHLGRIEVHMDAATNRPVIQASCVPMTDDFGQSEASSIIRVHQEQSELRLGRVVAELSMPMAAWTNKESPLGNLLAGGLRRWTDAEIGIVNSGQLLGGLAEGEVTAGDLHALCPSPINPCRMLLTGRDIRMSLEEALLPEFVEKPIRGFGFRGSVLGTLAVDGLEIHYDERKPPYSRILSVSVNGCELEAEKDYRVGTIDMFTFGAGYEKIKNGEEVVFFLPEFIRDVLERELRNNDALQDSFRRRWLSL